MPLMFEAIYEDGVLKPVEPLPLAALPQWSGQAVLPPCGIRNAYIY
jgi:hypothetical protein